MRNIIKGPEVTWIDIQGPTNEDIKFLEKSYKLHPLILEELTQPSPRPSVEHNPNYLFMVFYYPVYDKNTRETISRELDIIVTKNTVITTHYQTILPVKRLFTSCNFNHNLKKNYLGKSSGHLLFYILDNLWGHCLTKLERIEKSIDQIEREIFKEKEREMVREISYVKTDLIGFWRIIEPQKEILESLSKEGVAFFGKELQPYFSDLLGTFRKVWNNLTTNKEVILSLEDTNQSLLSTKINDIIRVLTIFSVIILPLTLLSSIWGMNFSDIPLAEVKAGFWMLLFIMVFMVGFMIFYFKRKKWI